jgi:hypothetical protein
MSTQTDETRQHPHEAAIEWINGEALIAPYPHIVAQFDTWNWLENHSGRYDHGSGAVFALDGGVFACGSYAAGGYEEGAGWVGRFSEAGVLRWFRTFDTPNSWEHAQAIALANDGGVFVAGRTQIAPERPGHHQAWLIRLDSDGHTLWAERLGRNPREVHIFDSVVALDDGGAVVLGWNIRGVPDGNAWLVRFASDGRKVWEREVRGNTLPGLLNLRTRSLSLSPAGQLYFAITGTNACWLHAFDLDGRLVWRRRFELADYSFFANTGLHCDALGVTAVGIARAAGLKIFSWVSRFDLSGSPLWMRTYNKGGSDTHSITAVACLDEHRTLLAGTSGGDFGGSNAWLEVLDRDGTVEGHRNVAIGYENRLASVHATRDGRLCAAGHCNPLVESLPRIWIHRSPLAAINT